MRQLPGLTVLLPLLLLPHSVLALVNINAASLNELDQEIPGVGPATAQKIVDYRNTNGAFSTIDQVCALVGQYGVGTGTDTCKGIEAAIYFGPFGSGGDGSSTQSSTGSGASSAGSATRAESAPAKAAPITGLVIHAPQVAHVNQPIEFAASPSDGVRGRTVRYRWNFGDGNTAAVGVPVHSYRHPGTYVVVVESRYLNESVMQRHEITVLPVSLSVTEDFFGEVIVANTGSEEVDLSGMKVAGRGEFVFPPHSILLPGKSVAVRLAGEVSAPTAAVYDQAGKMVAARSDSAAEAKPPPRPANYALAAAPAPAAAPSEPEDRLAEPEVPGASQPAAAAGAALPSGSWPYLALFGIIAAGLFAVYGTARA